jgi:hypothetical protein
MRMNRVAALGVGAGMLTMTACADAPTAAPSTAAYLRKTSSFALNDVTNSAPVAGQLKICKAGNVGGTFQVTFNAGAGGAGVPSAQTPIAVANGECRVAGLDAGDASQEKGDFFHVTENAAADPTNTTQVLTSCVDLSGPTPCANFANNYFINNVHGVTVTYTNTFTPPPEPPADVCDFSTFGGDVLTPNNISYGGNAGRISDPPAFAYGSLNFKNHTNGDHIHVWNVTNYGHPQDGPLSQYENSRLAYGLGSINDGPVNVPVEFRFVDLGEPAKKVGDAVYLKVGNTVLIPEQVVIGGNIQLHSKCKKAPKAEKH